jgi:hypothetical protein
VRPTARLMMRVAMTPQSRIRTRSCLWNLYRCEPTADGVGVLPPVDVASSALPLMAGNYERGDFRFTKGIGLWLVGALACGLWGQVGLWLVGALDWHFDTGCWFLATGDEGMHRLAPSTEA